MRILKKPVFSFNTFLKAGTAWKKKTNKKHQKPVFLEFIMVKLYKKTSFKLEFSKTFSKSIFSALCNGKKNLNTEKVAQPVFG